MKHLILSGSMLLLLALCGSHKDNSGSSTHDSTGTSTGNSSGSSSIAPTRIANDTSIQSDKMTTPYKDPSAKNSAGKKGK